MQEKLNRIKGSSEKDLNVAHERVRYLEIELERAQSSGASLESLVKERNFIASYIENELLRSVNALSSDLRDATNGSGKPVSGA